MSGYWKLTRKRKVYHSFHFVCQSAFSISVAALTCLLLQANQLLNLARQLRLQLKSSLWSINLFGFANYLPVDTLSPPPGRTAHFDVYPERSKGQIKYFGNILVYYAGPQSRKCTIAYKPWVLTLHPTGQIPDDRLPQPTWYPAAQLYRHTESVWRTELWLTGQRQSVLKLMCSDIEHARVRVNESTSHQQYSEKTNAETCPVVLRLYFEIIVMSATETSHAPLMVCAA